MTKRILFILSIAMLMIVCSVEARNLKVYAVTGKVLKKNGNAWVALDKNAAVGEMEIVKINPASSLKILDSGNRQIHTFTTQGEFKVADLLKKSASESASISGRINSEIRNNISASNTKSHKAVGAAKRALWEDEEIERFFSAVMEGIEKGEDKGDIEASKVETDEGLFYMEFKNSGTESMYINLFVGGEDSDWYAVYDFEEEDGMLLLPAGETIRIEHVTLASMPGDKFMVVGYKEPFDSAQIIEMLGDELEPEEEALEGVSIYFVK